MSSLRFCALLSVLVIAACPDRGESPPAAGGGTAKPFTVTPTLITYCCEPGEPGPIHVGQVTLTNDNEEEIDIDVGTTGTSVRVLENGDPVGRGVTVPASGSVTLDIQVTECEAPMSQSFFFAAGEGDPIYVSVRWDCPEEEPPQVTILTGCNGTAAERIFLVEPLDRFDASDLEIITAGADSGHVCQPNGAVLKEIQFARFHGAIYLPEVPGEAPEAAAFYGPDNIMITSWIDGNNAFGFNALGNLFVSTTDIVPAGDPAATDLFMAVVVTNKTIVPVIPTNGFWGTGGQDVMQNTIPDPAWGVPVTAYRGERSGDTLVAFEYDTTAPGTVVLLDMGGDDVADSATEVGETPAQPRVMRGLDSVAGVTCYGGGRLALFWENGAGWTHVTDAVVGDRPLGLAVTKLSNGNVAFLTTGSGDDTWSVTTVDPATGTFLGTTTQAVPPEIDEPTDIAVSVDGTVYIIGKASQNIAVIVGALE